MARPFDVMNELAPDAAERRPAAISALYEAFSECSIPETLSYCTYCDHGEYERALHAPLGALPRELMNKYLADAIHHTGSAQDFSYFVPRILELEHEATLDWFWVLPDRLTMAGWGEWSDRRRAAVCRALESAARASARSDAWLDTVARVNGVDWSAIFPRLPGLDEPQLGQSEWLCVAILRRAVTDGHSALDRALSDWLDSPEGARFAEAFLVRHGWA